MDVSKLVRKISIILLVLENVLGKLPTLRAPHCTIPSFPMKFSNITPSLYCGERHIYIRKHDNHTIQFHVKKQFASCCYSYIHRSTEKTFEDKKVRDSNCVLFTPDMNTTLKHDLINVRCESNEGITEYNDYYAMIHHREPKIHKTKINLNATAPLYNVILLGMDSMSRARAYNSLPKTVKLLREKGWLDFMRYNKIDRDTITNLMAILTGQKSSSGLKEGCAADMSACNHMFMWSRFKKAGYVTAYAEDGLGDYRILQKNSNGFRKPPTDHYMVPLFLAAETTNESSVCSGHMLSAGKILNYILDFGNTYKNETYRKFFGFFWIKSMTHGDKETPKPYDEVLAYFFTRLEALGALNNTFMIFFGDQGLTSGPYRYSIASYFDERLPMLLMHVPKQFKELSSFENLKDNQNRLISPYDVYLTLRDILKISANVFLVPRSRDCPLCKSLFQLIPEHRTCSEAGISDQWCSCHSNVSKTVPSEFGGVYSLIRGITYLSNQAKDITTKECTKCKQLSFKETLRMHNLMVNQESNYFVGALVMSPNDMTYEVIVRKYVNYPEQTYYFDLVSIQLISKYNGTGSCVVQSSDMHFCVCEDIDGCRRMS